jgi:RNA polymerase sigma-70 factor (ECF subfamily)
MSTQELVTAFPKLWRYCLGLTQRRAEADDLAQATCLRALEHLERFNEKSFPDRWLIKVARNLWLNQLKAERVRKGGGLVPADRVDLEDLTSSPELDLFTRQVFSAVMDLPEAQRDTVLLAYVEGCSYKETANILDIPIGTVMSRLADARRKLSVLKGEASVEDGELEQGRERHGSL